MKWSFGRACLLPVLLTAVYSIPVGGVKAQTFKVLHSFSAPSGPDGPDGNNPDGARPASGLLLSGTILYGTAFAGGTWGNGAVFKINVDGAGFTTLHSFATSDAN